MTQSNLDSMSKNCETSIKNMEMQIGQLSRQLTSQTSGGFNGSTLDNHKNESCIAFELRAGVVSMVKNTWSEKKICMKEVVHEVVVEKEKNK